MIEVCLQWRIQDFPEEGCQLPGGAPTYDIVNCCGKLHENEEILAAGGGARVPCAPPPLDPPLVCICVFTCVSIKCALNMLFVFISKLKYK